MLTSLQYNKYNNRQSCYSTTQYKLNKQNNNNNNNGIRRIVVKQAYNNNNNTSNSNNNNTTIQKSNKRFTRYISYAIVSLISLYIITHYICGIIYGSGWSMFPTFNPSGVFLLYECITRQYQHGDIVLVHARIVDKNDKNNINIRHTVKRIIGLPGDTIKKLDPITNNVIDTITLHDNEYWVQGDLLPASLDSREYGPVDRSQISARVIAIVLPISEAKWLDRTLQYRGY